ESGTNGRQQHQVAFLQLAFVAGSVHRQRDGSGGGVAVAVDVDDHAFGTKAEAVGGRSDNASVGLMWDEGGNVGAFEAVSLKKLFADLGLLANCNFEDRLPVLVDVVHLLIDGLVRRRIQAAPSGHVKRARSGAIHFVHEI